MFFNKVKTLRPRSYLFLFVLLGLVSTIIMVPGIRMRVHVVFLQVTGQIPGISLAELVDFMKPSSGVSIGPLITKRNPHAAIRHPNLKANDVQNGALVYAEKCASCHGGDGHGGVASPSLANVELKQGVSDWAIYKTIRNGIPDTAMAAHSLNGSEIWQLVAFIRSLSGAAVSKETLELEKKVPVEVSVRYEELLAIPHPENDWLTYSGSYRSNRNSILDKVDKNNVHELALKWTHQFSGKYGKVETSPLIRNEVMYFTVSNRIVALDAHTGNVIWNYEYEIPEKAVKGTYAGIVNRGVAIMGDKVYLARADARLVAVSANTGKLIWESEIEQDLSLYNANAAPLAFKDLIVTGISAKIGGRGVIVAFDANTGLERWRFHTIPGPGQEGNETWEGDSWRTGGASTWLTGSYDVENDILYWGVGNPKPDYLKAARKGDNLYSNSVVALRGTTGKLLWHFQFSPGDGHDWDSVQIPVLADQKIDGEMRKLLLWANRNGFYYILDRITGEYIQATPFIYQTWAEGIDTHGRPVLKAINSSDRDGLMVFPSNKGGTNWWSPSYDPELGLMFVPTLEKGMVFFPGMETNSPPVSAGSFYTAVRALNSSTGELIWEHRHASRTRYNDTGGLLSTQGGVIFGSDMSTFFVLDSHSGKKLWEVNTGGQIVAAPVTFLLGDKQFVTIAAGGDLMTFGLPEILTRDE